MGVKKQLPPVGGRKKNHHFKHMICIYESVETHDTVSPSKVHRPCGAGGETALLQQKSEVSAENISQRVRYCE